MKSMFFKVACMGALIGLAGFAASDVNACEQRPCPPSEPSVGIRIEVSSDGFGAGFVFNDRAPSHRMAPPPPPPRWDAPHRHMNPPPPPRGPKGHGPKHR